MDEKELDKKLNSDVKPGEEQFKINEAQNAANNLLTEQRANLESEKQIANANSTRDTELRGALELGAMSQEAAPQQQVALPPQAAGLRPETQQLLAKYGVNPTITESSRSNSNTNRTRSSTSNSQRMPNQNGGETRVTNTTNITNITNNNTETETNVDMPPAPPTPVVTPAPVRQPANNTNQFKTYMDNIFRKRDAEKALQEREFRKRDWSLQRMTRKVMARMESISSDFARKMNPENIGRTFWSQMKVFLFAAGLAILPKVFPKLINGIDSLVIGVTDAFNFIKTTFNSKDGTFVQKVGKTIADVVSNVADRINKGIGRAIAGKDYKEGQEIGIAKAISDKLSAFLGGRDKDGNIRSLPDQLKLIANEIKNGFEEYMKSLMNERAEAVKSVIKNSGDWELTDILNVGKLFRTLADVVGAAFGGMGYLKNAAANKMQKEAQDKLKENSSGPNKYGALGNAWNAVTGGSWGESSALNDEANYKNGQIRTSSGADAMIKALTNMASDDSEANSAGIYEAIRSLRDYSSSGNSISIRESQLDKILNGLTVDGNKRNAILDRISNLIENGGITVKELTSDKYVIPSESGKYTTVTDKLLTVSPEYSNTFLSLLSGLDEGSFNNIMEEDNYTSGISYLDSIRKSKIGGSIHPSAVFDNIGQFGSSVRSAGLTMMLGGSPSEVWNSFASKYDWGAVYESPEEKLDMNRSGANEYAEAYDRYKEQRKHIRDDFWNSETISGVRSGAKQEAKEYKEKAGELAEKATNAVVETGRDIYATGKDLVMTGLYGKDYTGDQGGGSSQSTQSSQLPKVEKRETETTEAEVTSGTSTETTTLPQAPMLNVEDYAGPELAPVAINKGSKPTETTEAVGGLTPYIARPDLIDENGNVKTDSDEFLNPGIKNTKAVRDRRAKYIMDWLIDKGFSVEQAAGITGVIYAESRYDPGAINTLELKKYGYGPTGKGICQWSNKRDDEFVEWYKNKYNLDEGIFPEKASLNDQLEFMLYDMNKRKAFMKAIKSTNSVDEAADYMLRGYENGGINAMASKEQLDSTYSNAATASNYKALVVPRIQFAKSVYENYTGNKLPSTIDPSVLEYTEVKDYLGETGSSSGGSFAQKLSGSWEGAIDALDNLLGGGDSVAAVQKLPAEMQEFTDKLGSEETEAEATQAQMNTQMPAVVANMESTAKGLLNYQPTDNGEAPEDATDTSQTQQPQMISTVGPTTSVNNSGNTSITNLIINDPKNSFVDMKSRDHRHN